MASVSVMRLTAQSRFRDRSACVSLQRVAKEGGATGGRQVYADEWLPFYHLEENEKEFPVRLKQVRIVSIYMYVYIPSL